MWASPNVGGVKLDTIRNVSGAIMGYLTPTIAGDLPQAQPNSAIYWGEKKPSANLTQAQPVAVADVWDVLSISAARGVPVGSVNRPRSFGVLACAWLGLPHTAD